MYLGSCKLDAVYLGSCKLSKVYLGLCEVFGKEVPVFDGIYVDPDTAEMVFVGTENRAGSLWLSDFEGVYREFRDDEPGWRYGRLVRNYIPQASRNDLTTWTETGDAVVLNATTFNSGSGTVSNRVSIATTEVFAIGDTLTSRITITSDTNTTFRFALRQGGFNIGSVSFAVTAGVQYVLAVSGPAMLDTVGQIWLYDLDGNGSIITVGDVQIERKNGASDAAIPSEFLSGGPKVFGTTNGNTVASDVLTEARGANLPQQPQLTSMPESTNEIFYSRDISQWTLLGGSGTATQDEIGIDGKPNTASTCTDSDVGAIVTYKSNVIPLDDTGDIPVSAFAYFKKTTGAVVGPSLYIRLSGAVAENGAFAINTNNGTIGSVLGSPVGAVESVGDFWKLTVSVNNTNANTSVELQIIPAAHSNDFVLNASLTGSCIVDAVNLYQNTALDLAKAVSPIFTEGTAVTRPRCDLFIDPANHDDTVGIWYAESAVGLARDDVTNYQQSVLRLRVLEFNAVQNNSRTYDSVTAAVSPADWVADEIKKMAVRYGNGTFRGNTDGVWGDELAYSGDLGQSGTFTGAMGAQYVVPHYFIKLQRYDSDNERIVDGLMS